MKLQNPAAPSPLQSNDPSCCSAWLQYLNLAKGGQLQVTLQEKSLRLLSAYCCQCGKGCIARCPTKLTATGNISAAYIGPKALITAENKGLSGQAAQHGVATCAPNSKGFSRCHFDQRVELVPGALECSFYYMGLNNDSVLGVRSRRMLLRSPKE